MNAPSVSHVEWRVTDLARSEAFLQQLFGWQFVAFSRHYRLYTPPAGTCVGLMESTTVQPTTATLVHVQVDDIAAYLKRARQLGAPVVTESTPIPAYGWYAQVLDPDGNVVGLFQALQDA